MKGVSGRGKRVGFWPLVREIQWYDITIPYQYSGERVGGAYPVRDISFRIWIWILAIKVARLYRQKAIHELLISNYLLYKHEARNWSGYINNESVAFLPTVRNTHIFWLRDYDPDGYLEATQLRYHYCVDPFTFYCTYFQTYRYWCWYSVYPY